MVASRRKYNIIYKQIKKRKLIKHTSNSSFDSPASKEL